MCPVSPQPHLLCNKLLLKKTTEKFFIKIYTHRIISAVYLLRVEHAVIT